MGRRFRQLIVMAGQAGFVGNPRTGSGSTEPGPSNPHDPGRQGPSGKLADVPAVVEAVVIGLLISQIAFVITTVYLHRTLAHRAVALKSPVAFACRFIIWMSTGTRPRQWVAVHRKHHAHSDKEGDPHSPVVFWATRSFSLATPSSTEESPEIPGL